MRIFRELEQCEVLGFPLDYYPESPTPASNMVAKSLAPIQLRCYRTRPT